VTFKYQFIKCTQLLSGSIMVTCRLVLAGRSSSCHVPSSSTACLQPAKSILPVEP